VFRRGGLVADCFGVRFVAVTRVKPSLSSMVGSKNREKPRRLLRRNRKANFLEYYGFSDCPTAKLCTVVIGAIEDGSVVTI
jgi:hypothetical protein